MLQQQQQQGGYTPFFNIIIQTLRAFRRPQLDAWMFGCFEDWREDRKDWEDGKDWGSGGLVGWGGLEGFMALGELGALGRWVGLRGLQGLEESGGLLTEGGLGELGIWHAVGNGEFSTRLQCKPVRNGWTEGGEELGENCRADDECWWMMMNGDDWWWMMMNGDGG